MDSITRDKPWEDLHSVLDTENVEQLTDFLESLSPAETALAVSRLSPSQQEKLLCLLDPSIAADVIEDVPEAHAADIIEDLPPKLAAAIVEELQSDIQADILAELDEENVEAILQEMPATEAEEARILLSYPAESAGGIMTNEFLTYHSNTMVRDVIEDLRVHREDYTDYEKDEI